MPSITIKSKFEDDLRRFSVDPQTITFDILQDILAKLYERPSEFYGQFQIRYNDDEGDVISVTNDSELQEALSLAEKLVPPLLRLTLLTANPISPALLNSFLDIKSSQIAHLPQQQQQPKQSSPTELAWQTESQSQPKLTGSLLASTSKPVILSSQLPDWGKKSSPGSSNNNSPSSSAGDADDLQKLIEQEFPSSQSIAPKYEEEDDQIEYGAAPIAIDIRTQQHLPGNPSTTSSTTSTTTTTTTTSSYARAPPTQSQITQQVMSHSISTAKELAKLSSNLAALIDSLSLTNQAKIDQEEQKQLQDNISAAVTLAEATLKNCNELSESTYEMCKNYSNNIRDEVLTVSNNAALATANQSSANEIDEANEAKTNEELARKCTEAGQETRNQCLDLCNSLRDQLFSL